MFYVTRARAVDLVAGMLACLSLWTSFTNLVPVTAIIVGALAFLPVLVLTERRYPAAWLAGAVWIGYLLVSSVLYDPGSFGEFRFYRYDANVLVAFSGFLGLAALRLAVDVRGVVRSTVYWAAAVNALFLAHYLLVGYSFHRPGGGVYFFLFESHNGAGGYLAVLSSLGAGYWLVTRQRWMAVATLVHLAGLWLTDSRGSILGLAAALAFTLVRFLRGWLVPSVLVFHVLLIALIVRSTDVTTYYVPEEDSGELLRTVQAPGLRADTVLDRFYYIWPRAVYLFFQSPVFGAGFGSFNDLPYDLHGIPHVVMWNQLGTALRTLNDGHAHESYLHVLAETGIVGLVLMLIFLEALRRSVLKLSDPALRLGLHIGVCYAAFSSCSEHRFTTPAQAMPLMTIVGLAMAAERGAGGRERQAAGAGWKRHPAAGLAAGCVASAWLLASAPGSKAEEPGTFRSFLGVNAAREALPEAWRGRIGWQRRDLSWARMEPVRGSWRQEELEAWGAWVLARRAEGIEVLPMLGYNTDWSAERKPAAGGIPLDRPWKWFKPGAEPNPRHNALAPEAVGAWTGFVERVARFLAAPPYHVRYFQIWNEAYPKTGFWRGSVDAFFERVHTPGARAVKAAGGRVVYGGWPKLAPLEEYWEALDRHQAWTGLDVLDVHYRKPEALARLAAAAAERGFARLPIWQTEFGEERDAAFVAKQIPRVFWWGLRRAAQPDAHKLFYYPWSDPKGKGLVDGDRETGSGRVVAALAQWLGPGRVEAWEAGRASGAGFTLDVEAPCTAGFRVGDRLVIYVDPCGRGHPASQPEGFRVATPDGAAADGRAWRAAAVVLDGEGAASIPLGLETATSPCGWKVTASGEIRGRLGRSPSLVILAPGTKGGRSP